MAQDVTDSEQEFLGNYFGQFTLSDKELMIRMPISSLTEEGSSSTLNLVIRYNSKEFASGTARQRRS